MTRYRRSPDALSNDVGDDVVALQAVRGFAFGMEEVTATVWHLVEQERSEKELVGALLDEYEVEPEQCRADVAGLLEQLEAEGLIEEVAA